MPRGSIVVSLPGIYVLLVFLAPDKDVGTAQGALSAHEVAACAHAARVTALENALAARVGGLPGVTRASVHAAGTATPLGQPSPYPVVVAHGATLADFVAVPEIDARSALSNDPAEVLALLGINAAREVLYNEFVRVLSPSGGDLNRAHLDVLARCMTCHGVLSHATRYGIPKRNDALASATLGNTLSEILCASRMGAVDSLCNVTKIGRASCRERV